MLRLCPGAAPLPSQKPLKPRAPSLKRHLGLRLVISLHRGAACGMPASSQHADHTARLTPAPQPHLGPLRDLRLPRSAAQAGLVAPALRQQALPLRLGLRCLLRRFRRRTLRRCLALRQQRLHLSAGCSWGDRDSTMGHPRVGNATKGAILA